MGSGASGHRGQIVPEPVGQGLPTHRDTVITQSKLIAVDEKGTKLAEHPLS